MIPSKSNNDETWHKPKAEPSKRMVLFTFSHYKSMFSYRVIFKVEFLTPQYEFCYLMNFGKTGNKCYSGRKPDCSGSSTDNQRFLLLRSWNTIVPLPQHPEHSVFMHNLGK